LYGSESLIDKTFKYLNEDNCHEYKLNYKEIINEYEKFVKNNQDNFGGFFSNDIDELVELSYKLYMNEKIWIEKLINGKEYFNHTDISGYENINDSEEKNNFSFEFNYYKLQNSNIFNLYNDNNSKIINLSNIYENILNHENNSSIKLKSKYIEMKRLKEDSK